MIQISEEVDGVAMVRCAADVRSSDQTGREGEVRYKDTLCPLKYLQEVWQQFNRRNSARAKRYRAATYNSCDYSMEKYYDCLQCDEQCHHVLLLSDSGSTSSATIRDSNVTTRNSSATYDSIMGFAHCETPKIITSIHELPYGLIKFKFGKKTNQRLRTPLTPARKRSSLARPVRVHDSFRPGGKSPQKYDKYLSDADNIWSIRYRLEEMALSRMRKDGKRRRKLGIKKAMQNDTERLLKVLSINRMDQSYYVKRCSVMWRYFFDVYL